MPADPDASVSREGSSDAVVPTNSSLANAGKSITLRGRPGPLSGASQVRRAEIRRFILFTRARGLDKRGGLPQASPVEKTKTVLIVDDDEETRHVLRLVCEDDGMEVVGEATNGVEAVRLALSRQPSFVILDYRLPRLDGEGASEILRAVSPDSKIVAFSALLDRKPEWADAYLNKDRITELMPLLRSFVR